MTRRSVPHGGASVALLIGVVFTLVIAGCGEASPSSTGSATFSPAASQAAVASGPSAAGPSTSQAPPASGSTAALVACDLLTPVEVAAIVGGPEPVAQPLPGGGWVASKCAWTGPSSNFLVSIGTAATISAFNDPAAPDAKSRFAAFKERLTAVGKTTDVAGVGDGAVLGVTGLAAYRGGTYLEILRLTLTDDQLIKVVTQAAARL